MRWRCSKYAYVFMSIIKKDMLFSLNCTRCTARCKHSLVSEIQILFRQLYLNWANIEWLRACAMKTKQSISGKNERNKRNKWKKLMIGRMFSVCVVTNIIIILPRNSNWKCLYGCCRDILSPLVMKLNFFSQITITHH